MILVEIRWPINPFPGDRFAEAWAPAAEAALDYGATHWELRRALDGRLDFVQTAVFPTKHDFERYWYSEEIAERKLEVAGLHRPGAAATDLLGDRGLGQRARAPA